MSAELVEIRPRKKGRPKGAPHPQTQRMLTAWDSVKAQHPKLNNAALLDLTAARLFGRRINKNVQRREHLQLMRALKRHGRC